jgi:hypothetical protein
VLRVTQAGRTSRTEAARLCHESPGRSLRPTQPAGYTESRARVTVRRGLVTVKVTGTVRVSLAVTVRRDSAAFPAAQTESADSESDGGRDSSHGDRDHDWPGTASLTLSLSGITESCHWQLSVRNESALPRDDVTRRSMTPLQH